MSQFEILIKSVLKRGGRKFLFLLFSLLAFSDIYANQDSANVVNLRMASGILKSDTIEAEADSAVVDAVSGAPVIGETVPVDVVSEDTVAKKKKRKKEPEIVYWKPDPNKAVWYSLICPGLGQIYNRSYWKVPVIYGGAAVLSYIVVWQGRMYNQYGNAYHDMYDNNPATNSYDDIFGDMDVTLEWKQKTLKNKRDYYRRNRDLCVFGFVLLYALNVIDAYVDGHLYDFSVTDDISFRVEPVLNNPLYKAPSVEPSFGFQCKVSF